MNQKIITSLALISGLGLLGIAVVYFIYPANALPSFFPGFDPNLTRHHLTHAVAALGLSLGVFAFAWLQSKPASTSQK